MAKKVVETAIKVSGAKNEADVIDILNADPVKAAQVAEAIRADEMELTRLAYEDMKDARLMYRNTDHTTADLIGRQVMQWNGVLIALLIILYGVAYMFSKDAIVSQAIGALLGGAIISLQNERQTVLGFHFGSSAVSRNKDLTIQNLSK